MGQFFKWDCQQCQCYARREYFFDHHGLLLTVKMAKKSLLGNVEVQVFALCSTQWAVSDNGSRR